MRKLVLGIIAAVLSALIVTTTPGEAVASDTGAPTSSTSLHVREIVPVGEFARLYAAAAGLDISQSELNQRQMLRLTERMSGNGCVSAKASKYSVFVSLIGKLLKKLAKKAGVWKKLKPLLKRGWKKLKKGAKVFAKFVANQAGKFVVLMKRGLKAVAKWWGTVGKVTKVLFVFALESAASYALEKAIETAGGILGMLRRPVAQRRASVECAKFDLAA